MLLTTILLFVDMPVVRALPCTARTVMHTLTCYMTLLGAAQVDRMKANSQDLMTELAQYVVSTDADN